MSLEVIHGGYAWPGREPVLTGVNFRFDGTGVMSILGPNGAGKTTTMRILATLLPASGGRATIDGVDVAKNPRRVRTLVGYMPDFFGVYDSLKAWEYLDFYGRLYGLSAARRRELTEVCRRHDAHRGSADSET